MQSVFLNVKTVLLKLLVSQMVMENVPIATVGFFMNTYGILSFEKGVDCSKMSKTANIARGNAHAHVRRLQERGYLDRTGYRSWCLSKSAIKDRELVYLAKTAGISGYALPS